MLAECVHCGLCLQTCPTYRILREEPDSPRGRLHLMTSLADGQLAMTSGMREHLDLCLQCRACETACPAHLHFGTVMEVARAEAVEELDLPMGERVLRRLVFRELLPHPRRLRALGAVTRAYQRSGLRRLLGSRGALGRLAIAPGVVGRAAARLAAAEELLPELGPRSYAPPRSGSVPALGPTRRRVAFLSGCVAGVAFAEAHEATLRLARRFGAEVLVPLEQGCCGALHAHAGERELARELARRNVAAFEAAGAFDCDAILVNAAGCGAAMKEYGELLRDDEAWADRARQFSERVRDVSEWLLDRVAEDPPRGQIDAKVVCQDACHLAHGQNVRRQPREILRLIPGLQLVEMRDSDRCCGSAGIYNIQHPEIARQLGQERAANVRRTGASIVVSGNPGCIMQMKAYLRDTGIEVLHLVELLDRAYEPA